MNVEEFRDYCLQKRKVTEEFPFDENTLVFKVSGKMFALTGLNNESFRVNLKCDPQRAVDLRERYPQSIDPGYHMNKKHWNTVHFEEGLSDTILRELIDHSYELVIRGLTKKVREQYFE
ncbi:MAG: MmcQ/YjbR family DNA-binding protein [Saprospiraceae bacterium]|nr:MmcQ/YjbR family DNA-binding protein [Saprospiraceae bacterium]